MLCFIGGCHGCDFVKSKQLAHTEIGSDANGKGCVPHQNNTRRMLNAWAQAFIGTTHSACLRPQRTIAFVHPMCDAYMWTEIGIFIFHGGMIIIIKSNCWHFTCVPTQFIIWSIHSIHIVPLSCVSILVAPISVIFSSPSLWQLRAKIGKI